jgi:hypothetical protein
LKKGRTKRIEERKRQRNSRKEEIKELKKGRNKRIEERK